MCKVSNEVQSNKINRGASTAVSVYTHYQMRCYSKNPFLKTDPMYVSRPTTCASLATS